MSVFLHMLWLSLPLFAIVGFGYAVARVFKLSESFTDKLTKLCFMVLMPAMLFRLMTMLGTLPKVSSVILVAFFGGCLMVFVLGRIVSARLFGHDGVQQSVFALGGVFSNNVLLGLPLTKLLLGDEALPAVAFVLVFNALILWTLVTVSVEWARHGAISLQGFGRTALSVISNPIVASIVTGAVYGTLIGPLPESINRVLGVLGDVTAPAVLFVLGASLTRYAVHEAWRESLAICAMKLLVQPLVVYALAVLLKLSPLETRVVVLLASISVGVNVYLMARQFNSLQTAVASSLVLSTLIAAVTTPLVLALI
jgi:malonate transporter and related proteins